MASMVSLPGRRMHFLISIHLGLLLLPLTIGFPKIDVELNSQDQIQSCLSTGGTCIVYNGEVPIQTPLTTGVSPGVLVGAGPNSKLNLGFVTNLFNTSSSSWSFTNLTLANGIGDWDNAFGFVNGATLTLSGVKIQNFKSSNFGIMGVQASATLIMTDVEFSQCTGGGGSILYMDHSSGVITNLKMTQSQSKVGLYSNIFLVTSSLRLQGSIDFVDTQPADDGLPTGGIVATGSGSITSQANNPAMVTSSGVNRLIYAYQPNALSFTIGGIDMQGADTQSSVFSVTTLNATSTISFIVFRDLYAQNAGLISGDGSNIDFSTSIDVTGICSLKNILSSSVGPEKLPLIYSAVAASRIFIVTRNVFNVSNSFVPVAESAAAIAFTAYGPISFSNVSPSRGPIIGGSKFIMNANSTFSISDSTLSGNFGALSASNYSTMNITVAQTASFTNIKSNMGAVIYTEAGSKLMLNSTQGDLIFSSNAASQDGGAVYVSGDMHLLAPAGSIKFINNQAQRGGAIYWNTADTYSLSTSAIFQSNVATQRGCTVEYNTAVLGTCPALSEYQANNFVDNILNTGGSEPFQPCPIDAFCGTCTPPRPMPTAVCLGTTWIIPSQQIPSGTVITAPIVIVGNISIPSVTVVGVLNPGGPFINSSVCIGSIIVELTPEEVAALEKGSRTANLLSSTCDASATVISVVGATPDKSCKRIKVKTTQSTESISALFSIDSSRCRTWWIILVSVLGGVILLVVITMLLVTFNPTLKAKVRPFWARDKNANLS